MYGYPFIWKGDAFMRRWKAALASVLVLCTFAGCFGPEENTAPETTVVTMPEETILKEPQNLR